MRKFKNARTQKIYAGLRALPPTARGTALGNAYFFGFDHPNDGPNSPACGARGSDTYAAWAAGVDNARATKRT